MSKVRSITVWGTRTPAFGTKMPICEILGFGRCRTQTRGDPMRNLSAAGRQTIEELARRHGFGTDAVASMLQSVVDGRGSMAQFSHPEFGGSGQWMRGGMIMVSDMFNNVLKGRIDALCTELSALVANEPEAMSGGSFQSQSQGDAHQRHDAGLAQQQGGSGSAGPVSLFVAPAGGSSGGWWPADLGRPQSTGAQNNVRYAYFATPRRLAIEANGILTIYDTLDHRIGGFGQQQSRGASLTFSSQNGLVDVASLPVVPAGGGAKPAVASTQQRSPGQQRASNSQPAASASDILATIEKLAELRDKGILSDQEFAAKKAELLSRI
jgi:hypothetical protein